MISEVQFDIAVLQDYKARKLLRCQQHPKYDLFIWNYSDIVQAKNIWDDVTTRTRGLITDSTGAIKARSFKKFYNIEQNRHKETDTFTITEKVDGSLIILFYYEGEWIVTSRGSFTSPQADYAKNLIDTIYDISGLNKELSYVFEVIYPENRVVVDYKDRKELIFLAAFAKDGTEIDSEEAIKGAGIPIVKKYDFHDYRAIKNLNWENCEGFVVRFSNGERVKVKFEDYLRIHGRVTNLSGLGIWMRFSKGEGIEDILEDMPDEFYAWVQEKWVGFKEQFDKKMAAIRAEYEGVLDMCTNRKEFAKYAAVSANKRELFGLFDGVDITGLIMQSIKPVNGELDVPYNGTVTRDDNKDSDIDALGNNKPTEGKLIILIGCSGSGKSTWAAEYISKNPNTVRVNRDYMRQQLFGYTPDNIGTYYLHPSLKTREDIITRLETSVIRDALQSGCDVIVDNTNLTSDYIQRYLTSFPYTAVSYKLMDTTIIECMIRDSKRPSPVGEVTIRKQFSKLEKLKKSSFFKKLGDYSPLKVSTIQQNSELPRAYIFDLDGTLADCSWRSPYDWKSVDRDPIIEPIKNTLLAHKRAGFHIIICSGRDGICENLTRDWLKKHGVPFDELHMRSQNNTKPDWVVKEGMWRHISARFYIVGMYDDRNSVVCHARKCGFTVFQVIDGDY